MVIRAKILGYCMGVRRAVDTALDTREKYPNSKIYTLGPLIHNKTAIEMLQTKGIDIIDINSVENMNIQDSSTVVILSAHGTPHIIKQKLKDAGAQVVDATCPRVLVNQKRIKKYASRGFCVFIVGDKTHGEVIALEGSVPNNCPSYVLQNSLEAEEMMQSIQCKNKNAILISQTTITQDEYEKVSTVLQSFLDNIIVFDTICPATLERQKALKELFYDVDGIVVIGGKNSANTERLYHIAQELGNNEPKPVCYIETANEIPKEFFLLKKIGLTAGASTPDEVIAAVEYAFIKQN